MGVEILIEKKNENKIGNSKFYLETINSNDNKTTLKHKKSTCVEVDSEYMDIEDLIELKSLETNNNLTQNIGNQKNLIYKKNNNTLLNTNYLSNKDFINIQKKNKKKLNSNKTSNKTSNNNSNKTSNKTLDYNPIANNSILGTPESNEKREKGLTKIQKRIKSHFLFSCCDCKDILLVDDDEFILKTSKKILKAFKLEADCAENGQECLNMIKAKQEKNCNCSKNKYKIILMDITMPIMDGIEAAKNIQKKIDEKKLYDSLKIIFISAHVNLDLSTILSGIKCAIDYYAKPISGDKYKSLLDKYYYSK